MVGERSAAGASDVLRDIRARRHVDRAIIMPLDASFTATEVYNQA